MLKVSKFQKQIFQPKLLPKNEPTNLFFYPDYLSGYKNKFDGSVFGRSLAGKIVFDFYWPLEGKEEIYFWDKIGQFLS